MNALSRRTLLRGAGAAIALPYLGAMESRAQGSTLRPRFLGLCGFINGYAGKFGPNDADPVQNAVVAPWTPDQVGAGYTPDPFFLKQFFDRGVGSKLTVMTGFSDRTGCHQAGIASFLATRGTRCQWNNGCIDTPDLGTPSVDQQLAKSYADRGEYANLPSLALTTCTPFRVHDYISWKTGTEPADQLINPKEVFQKLFGGGPSQSEREAQKRRHYRKSILDGVKDSADGVKRRLGVADLQKFSLYLDSVRELELQVDALPPVCNAASTLTVPDPDAIPDYYSYTDHLEMRVPVMMNLIAKAFECDRTRVVSLMLESTYGVKMPFLGMYDFHHLFSHYDQGTTQAENDARKLAVDRYCQWALGQLCDLMVKLDAVQEPDGSTVLDNTIVYMGGDFADGARHTNTSMPVLLAGRGGRGSDGAWRVKSGRHWRANPWPGSDPRWVPGLPSTNPVFEPYAGEQTVRDLLWGIMNACGLPGLTAASFSGAATAPIDLSTL